ncbi:hypothetical protein HF888_14200 [Bermanella marisrubri]|nr:replication protein P [Bermanella marisrubri]QIZ85305.1 hypothetical protein HF888_14200 [Bermanella marisrubri]
MDKATQQPLNEITQQIQALPTESKISAGQTISKEQKEALAASFELMRINYGNQFNAAYPNVESSTAAMRLWLTNLKDFSADLIQKVAEEVIRNERYLPNLATFRQYCENAYSLFGLPDSHRAYIEACRAPQPKANFNWTHPAIYYAGKATDWFFLSSEPEDKVFPIFKHNYQMLCERVIKGETLDDPIPKALPQETTTPLSGEANLQHLKALRDELEL